jgi:predicted amidophosphoribosyltransferase
MVEPARRLARHADLGEAAGHLVLAPVPLDPGRLRKRGFNQAGLLAAGIAAATEWSVLPAGLRRRRGRRRQAELGRSERLANVGSAFEWEPGVGVPGRPMLLVDDVLTTGATAAACTAAIEKAGGTCIGVVTFARSLPRFDGA